jgi:hypothetical protein
MKYLPYFSLIVGFIIGILSLFELLVVLPERDLTWYKRGYRQGQIDYANGKVKPVRDTLTTAIFKEANP